MKKTLYLFPLFAFCFFLFSCSKEEPADENIKKTKLVSTIIRDFSSFSDTLAFTYDNQNRVISIKNNSSDGDQYNLSFTYFSNTVACSFIGQSNRGEPFKSSATATLNSEGYIVSGIGVGLDIDYEDPNIKADSIYNWSATYDNGFLGSLTEWSSQTYTCSWINENMASIQFSSLSSIAKYDTTYSNLGNLDMNWLIYSDEYFNRIDPFGFSFLGLYGKRSKNLVIKTIITNGLQTNYTYKFDNDGYITKWTTGDFKTSTVEYK